MSCSGTEDFHASKLAPYFEKVIIVGKKTISRFSTPFLSCLQKASLRGPSEILFVQISTLRSQTGWGQFGFREIRGHMKKKQDFASKRFITIRSLRQLPGVIRSWLSRGSNLDLSIQLGCTRSL